MAKTFKRVSINQLESSIIKDDIIIEPLAGAEDVKIRIHKVISLPEMIAFVQEVVEACIDGESGEYLPESYDFAIRAGVLTHYANFTLPSNLEKQYWILYRTEAFNQVMRSIDKCQFENIINAIDRKIKFKLNLISSSAITAVNEMIGRFSEIAENVAKALNGVNAEDMAMIFQNVAKVEGLDETELAKAVLNLRTDTEESALESSDSGNDV